MKALMKLVLLCFSVVYSLRFQSNMNLRQTVFSGGRSYINSSELARYSGDEHEGTRGNSTSSENRSLQLNVTPSASSPEYVSFDTYVEEFKPSGHIIDDYPSCEPTELYTLTPSNSLYIEIYTLSPTVENLSISPTVYAYNDTIPYSGSDNTLHDDEQIFLIAAGIGSICFFIVFIFVYKSYVLNKYKLEKIVKNALISGPTV